MPATSTDIVFNCLRCRGSIMVEACHVGETSECPHCYESIEIPEVSAVDKDRFLEPPGLRRILQEVSDREWEHMRRKLRTAKAQITRLEKQLLELEEASARQLAVETEALERQLAELGDKFILANKAFTAGRKQHALALEKLRLDLDAARAEAHALEKQKDLPVQAFVKATADLEAARQEAASALDEVGGLEAALEWARCDAMDLHQKLVCAESELNAIQHKPREDEGEAEEIAVLRSELEKLEKSQALTLADNDRLQRELNELGARLAAEDRDDSCLEDALTNLEGGIQDAARLLACRRDPKFVRTDLPSRG